MITYFNTGGTGINAVLHSRPFTIQEIEKLQWLFGGATIVEGGTVSGLFKGPRREMITPWSTNATEIALNMGLTGISRIEQFTRLASSSAPYDRMLENLYTKLDQAIFTMEIMPEEVQWIEDIASYNKAEGLALSTDEIEYLEKVSQRIGRKLTDSEVFGFSQVNSEHCRHKIFNGIFIIDGEEQAETLFSLIKKTTSAHPNRVVSAYKDNVAFISGPDIEQFAPERQDLPSEFITRKRPSVISLKAETHNFPTTVEPFNGAATGTGGEIRDRLAGGKGSLPISGTAVYFTSYPRLEERRPWEQAIPARPWLYQTPEEILIKASNGASDFGNKFGQPLICGSLLTFEHTQQEEIFGFDKVIMLAGGVGYGYAEDAEKGIPSEGDLIIVMGGDNYRIGMGGGAVSSVATGEYSNAIELNAVQRSNPEMQKRVSNAIRAMVEAGKNPIVSIHDHGAGGHLNSLSELAESTGGVIEIRKLPIGDPTLSAKEIIGNESQERMGLIIKPEDLPLLEEIALRERAPMYVVGTITNNHRLTFTDTQSNAAPIDLEMADLFGKPPRTILEDTRLYRKFIPFNAPQASIDKLLDQVLQLESVACKDWLTNKVDRSVTGKVATQQCTGVLQLPLNDVGIVALDYSGFTGIANSIGHAPAPALIHPAAGSRLAVAEALTNMIWASLTHGIKGISLSANWMWPCKQPGEDARLYEAVQAMSDFCIELGINVPTGKDSLSMTQKYPDGSKVLCPGTVIVSAVAEVDDIRKTVTPVLKNQPGSTLIHIDFSTGNLALGGSALAQVTHQLGDSTPDVEADTLINGFSAVGEMMAEGILLAGHDISAGGIITTLLEMAFPSTSLAFEVTLPIPEGHNNQEVLFSERPGVVMQITDPERAMAIAGKYHQKCHILGKVIQGKEGKLQIGETPLSLDIPLLRHTWFKTSYLLDRKQSGEEHARERYQHLAEQPLIFRFPTHFEGTFSGLGIDPCRKVKTGIKAGIIREKGVNGDREMAWSMHLAGFDVRDIHMTDLISGRETLDDIHLLVFVGGFSNSDVLGSAKGWAGAFKFNPKAHQTLKKFYQRSDTLSLGVCNGCQLMVELDLLYPDHQEKPAMLHNRSGKFESAFLTIDITDNHSVMLETLAGCRLGIWIAHGEGQFRLPREESDYHIPAYYSFKEYPGNPNGSDFGAAAIASKDGRHLAIMPHLERSVYPWNWAWYPEDRKDEVSPWIEAFVNARKWVENIKDR